MNPTAIRYTLTLDPAENKLLLALQAVMQAQSGRRVPQSEVVREALRRFAASENIAVQ